MEDNSLSSPEPKRPVPPELKRWNWNAFLLNWYWCFAHRLWVAGTVTLAAPIIYYLLITFIFNSQHSHRNYNENIAMYHWFLVTPFICHIIGIVLGFTGNRLAFNAMHFDSVQKFEEKQRTFTGCMGGFLILLMQFIIFGLIDPHPHLPRNKSIYTACFEQLSNVKTGIESYLSENPSLIGMDPYGDKACNHILAGYKNPDNCKGGLVRQRVSERCDNFSVTIIATSTYAIIGNAFDKTQCGICITEKGGYPQEYDDCKPGPPDCSKAR